MKRIGSIALFVAILVVGCAKDKRVAKNDSGKPTDKDVRKIDFDKDSGKPPIGVEPPPPPLVDVVPSLPEMTADEKREAALLKAIDLLTEQKYADALEALRDAQKIKYTEQVEQEIIKVHALLARDTGAGKAVEDVKVVLDEGKPDEAAQLAGQALAQYGDGDKGGDLARLKQQAEAVLTAAAENAAARRLALVNEATKSLKDNNLRAAGIALEQAIAMQADAELSTQLADIQERIATYDNSRRIAVSYRKDPLRLNEALTHLEKAKKSWDTLQVRQEIDEYTLMLERRRDRLAVADFQLRGDIGVEAAGQVIAEELLPHFKSRFDLVERQQLGEVLEELKLETGELHDSPAARRELQRRARVRYLVVGSVSELDGVTINARLIEAATGLIVQTGRVSSPTFAGARKKLPQLALLLQMNDEQKLAFEAKLAQAVAVIKPIEAVPLVKYDPVPEVPATPPPPIITYTPRPPALGNVVITEFVKVPLVAVPPPPPPATLIIEGQRKHQLLRLCLELGDNLFRCGRYREANRHYGLALTLAGPRREISLRLDSCRRLAPPPPPPVVVFTGRPVVVVPPPVRPRLAVFTFVPGNVKLVPSAMGDWAADSISPYLTSRYELIDRGEACWYMGRLGITMADLLRDSGARVALARALNARYFLFGTIEPTASFNVATHLVDADTGVRTGTGAIHVKDQGELKLRVSELVDQMGLKPDEQKAIARQAAATEKALADARGLLVSNPKQAADIADAALKTAPNNVALLALREDARRRNQLLLFETQRRDEAVRRAAALEGAKKRQEELAKQGALARLEAERAAAARDKAGADAQKVQRDRAAEQLRAQAKQALMKGDPARAAQLMQSAVALKPADEYYRELGEARAAADKARQLALEAEQKKREQALAAQRDAALKRLEAERKTRELADAEARKAQEARDLALHNDLIKQAQTLLTKKEYAQSLALAQSARKAKPTAESAKLIQQAQDLTALAAASDAREKERLEKERKDREAADAKAKKTQDDYLAALDRGRDLVLAKKYDEAITQYQSALKLYKSDAALNGLKSAELLRKQEREAAEAKKAAQLAELKKADQIKDLLTQAGKARESKQYVKAKDLYRQVGKLSPGHVEALAGISRAEREESDELARLRREQAEKERLKTFTTQLTAAKAALSKKDRPGAAKILAEALKLYPDNAEVKKLYNEAIAGSQVEADYKLAMDAGHDALKKKLYKGAVNSFGQALVKKPDDPDAKARLAEAQKLLKGEQDGVAYDDAIKQAKSAFDKKQFAEAEKAYDSALVIRPGDATAVAGKKAAQTELARMADAGKREQAYTAAMKDGKSAMDAKKYPEALKAYERALTNKPNDAAATVGKKAAQTEITRSEEAGKREMAYQAAMKDGKAAMDGKKYAEASKAYATALTHKPNDPAATSGKKAADAELAKMADGDRREKAYAAAMKDGKAALDAKKYPEASKAYATALTHKPNDPAATSGKKAADFELAKMADADRREKGYAAAMKDGKAAMDAKKYAEAVKAYDTALVNKPGDAAAITGKKAAQAELDKPKPNPKEEAYQSAMKQAQAAMDKKQYEAAIKAYDAALAQKPGDVAATAGKKKAVDAFKPGPAPKKPDPNEEDFKLAMSAGQAAMKGNNYQGAVNAYTQAVKLKPADATAVAALKEAQRLLKVEQDKGKDTAYQAAMKQGKAAMDAKKFDDAVKAYDEALKVKPGDAAAIAGKKAATDAVKPPVKADPKAEFTKAMQQGATLQGQKKFADAASAYQLALKHANDLGDKAGQAQAYLGIARNEHAAKRFAEAIKAYEEVLKRSPNDAEAKAGLTKAKQNKTP